METKDSSIQPEPVHIVLSVSQTGFITGVSLLSPARLTCNYTGEQYHQSNHTASQRRNRWFHRTATELTTCPSPVNAARRAKEGEGQGTEVDDISCWAVRPKRALGA